MKLNDNITWETANTFLKSVSASLDDDSVRSLYDYVRPTRMNTKDPKDVVNMIFYFLGIIHD